ncbi:MAG: S53 family peptidase, partial [Acidimicrobiales bacterium]
TGLGIDGVIGLNNKLGAHTTNRLPSPSAPHGPAAPRPAQTTCGAGACVGLTTPQDLWSVYQQPTDLSNPNADFGQGQQMAVLGEGAVSGVLSDLRGFEHEHALPQIPVTIHSVGDDFQDTSGNGEWDIDMQASTGMAPKAFGETLYFAKDLTDPSVLGDIAAWGSDPNGPYQANASFGECEQDPTSPVTGGGATVGPGGLAGTAGIMFTQASENALQAATLQGKTLFSSTGDTGSSCPVVVAAVIGAGNGVLNQGYPETNYPASSPYATAVGGTVLYSTPNAAATPADPQASNATRFQETAWTFTGGGNTLYIPEPDYQHGIPMLDNQPCLTQPDGTPYATPTACRGIPDVTAQSGDIVSNGYAVTMSGVNDQAGGGTSLASPLWVGMWTRIQAAAPLLNGKYSLGFANCELYSIGLDHNRDPNDFFDIGGGPPGSPTTGNGIYASLPRNPLDASGWDYVSGLGAPKVTNLGRDLTADPTLGPRQPLTPPPAHDCGQPGLNPCSATCSTTSGLWSNSPHTATDTFGNRDPQLSLLRGAMSTTTDGKTLRLLLTVTNLSQTVPTGAGAAEWYMSWSYQGTQYFGNAELSAAPMS